MPPKTPKNGDDDAVAVWNSGRGGDREYSGGVGGGVGGGGMIIIIRLLGRSVGRSGPRAASDDDVGWQAKDMRKSIISASSSSLSLPPSSIRGGLIHVKSELATPTLSYHSFAEL